MARKSWHLMGSGPSRKQYPTVPDTLLASVNSGFTAGVSAYGVFEWKAGYHYSSAIRIQARINNCAVFLRPRIQRSLDALPPTIAIGKDWGPMPLRWLHENRQHAADPPGDVPNVGQSRSWISSGVLMAWILAELYKPPVIYITGIDGYQPGDPNEVGGFERTAEWCLSFNRHMADGIKALADYYDGTRFVFVTETLVAALARSEGARIEVLDEAQRDALFLAAPQPGLRE